MCSWYFIMTPWCWPSLASAYHNERRGAGPGARICVLPGACPPPSLWWPEEAAADGPAGDSGILVPLLPHHLCPAAGCQHGMYIYSWVCSSEEFQMHFSFRPSTSSVCWITHIILPLLRQQESLIWWKMAPLFTQLRGNWATWWSSSTGHCIYSHPSIFCTTY